MKTIIKFALLVCLLTAGLNHFTGQKLVSSDGPCGAATGPSWFTGSCNHQDGDFVLPGGTEADPSIPYSVNSISNLETFIDNNYSKSSCENRDWTAEGAGFIVQFMRNQNEPQDFLDQFGASPDYHSCPTNADIADWKNLLSYFDNSSPNHVAGFTVHWDATDTFTKNSMNLHDSAESDGDPNDTALYSTGSTSFDHVIEFIENGNLVFAIKHTCANPTKFSPNGIPLPDWTLEGKTYLNGQQRDDTNVSPTATEKFASQIKNTSSTNNTAPWGWKVEACYHDPNKDSHDCSSPSSDESNYSAKNCGQGGNQDCNDACPDGSGNHCLPNNLTAPELDSGDTHPSVNSDNEGGSAANNFKFPDGASVNSRYCEVIFFSYGEGPSDSSYDHHSAKVCAILGNGPSTTAPPPDCTTKSVNPASVVTGGTPSGTSNLVYIYVTGTGANITSDSSSVMFNHQINNNGSCPVKIQWFVNGSYSAGATSFGNNRCGGGTAADPGYTGCNPSGHLPTSGGSVTFDPGHNAPSYTSGAAQGSYHFTPGTPFGTIYCQDISYTGDLSGDSSGGKACVQLKRGSGPTGSSGTCPGDGKINANTIVTINLTPDLTPYGPRSGPSRPGDGGSPPKTVQSATDPAPTTYYQNVSEGKTNAVSAQDGSTDEGYRYGGTTVPLAGNPTNGPNGFVSQDQDGETADVDYQPFVKAYPYDRNIASVTYFNYYDTTVWDPGSPAYSCDGAPTGTTSTSRSGTTCTYVYGATSHNSCAPYASDGYFDDGTGCAKYEASAAISTNPSPPPDYTCSVGQYVPSRSACYSFKSYATTYTCDSGGSGPDGSNSCTVTGTATATYTWHSTGYYPGQHSPTGTAYGWSMQPCYARNFTVTWKSSNASLSPNNEDPTEVRFQGTANVTFSGDPSASRDAYPTLRQPSAVGLTETTDSSSEGLTGACHGTASTSVTGRNINSSVDVTIPAPYYPCRVKAGHGYLEPGDSVCGRLDISPHTGTYYADSPPVTVITDNGPESTFPCSDKLANIPYAHFFNGDAGAGGKFLASAGASCTVSTATANISAFVEGSGQLTRGSGSQLAALNFGGSGSINGIGTATLRTAPNYPTAQNGLTLANAGLGPMGTKHCEPDYMATDPVSGDGSLSGTVNFDSDSTLARGGAFDVGAGSNLTISGGTVRNNTAIYATGNVYITGNIMFAGSNGSWAYNMTDHTSTVPSLYIITTGNIYVSPDVSELDGVYVAQLDDAKFAANQWSTGGIYTCANTVAGAAFIPSEVFNDCSGKQLTVVGSLIAQHVYLYRTWGSLRDSAAGEYPDSANPSFSQCDTGDYNGPGAGFQPRTDASYDCASEIFMFSPEVYLSQPAIGGNPNGPVKYDFITSLSPVL